MNWVALISWAFGLFSCWGGSRPISSDSRLTHILTLTWSWCVDICPSTMVVPESEDKMYYPSDDMKRDAHVSDFNSYLALYRKSLENPEGRSSTHVLFVQRLKFCCLHAMRFGPISRAQHKHMQPVALMQTIALFQVSGKRLLMNSFGRIHQLDQWCSTTLIQPKAAYMLNAWKELKPTCVIMLSTGS